MSISRRSLVATSLALAGIGAGAALVSGRLWGSFTLFALQRCGAIDGLEARVAADYAEQRVAQRDRWILSESEQELLAQLARRSTFDIDCLE